MRKRLVHILCLATGLLLCGALLSEIFLYSQNTLLNNGNWLATKRRLAVAIIGADEFLITRSPLAGNALNLGAWYGYQEVLLKKAKDLREIEFKFNIPENSYLDIIVDKTGEKFSGIRLSRSRVYPPIYFSSDRSGRFTSAQPISMKEIGPGWHESALTFQETGNLLKIDRGEPIRIGSRPVGAGGLGFRGGFAGATIDDIIVKDASGATLKDSFRNEHGWLGLTVLHFALLAALFGLANFFLLKVLRWREAVVVNGSLIAVAQIFICLSLFHAFDFFYWSKLPFQMQMRLISTGEPVPQMVFEKYRFFFFKAWRGLVGEERNLYAAIAAEYPPERISQGPVFCGPSGDGCFKAPEYQAGLPKKRCVRLLLVGTSQSIGAGADSLDQSFFAQLHHGLRKSLKNRCVESLNLSISGSRLSELTPVFQKHAEFHPDIVILNLSNNDSEGGFYERLRQFIEANREIHAEVILVAEANSLDHGYDSTLKEKHEIMRRAGQDSGIEVFSMQEFLGNEEVLRSGQVWWDYVHLSSYGQTLVAEWLLPKVLARLNSRRGTPSTRP